jgi:hypothetical protein
MGINLEDINNRLNEFEKEHKPFRQFEPIGDDDFVYVAPKGPTITYYTVKKDIYNKLKQDTITELNELDDKYDPRAIELRTVLVMLDWIHAE